jgi:hypothetical protein
VVQNQSQIRLYSSKAARLGNSEELSTWRLTIEHLDELVGRLAPRRHIFCVARTAQRSPDLAAAPARFLDQSEELRMDLSNEQLICEAVECNHAGVGGSTLERYRDHLVHFAHYLASVHKSDFYKANKKQVRLFMGHLEKQGGANPDPARLRCDWCKARGYPDGREGPGWSASYRKSYLSALRFLYEGPPRAVLSPSLGNHRLNDEKNPTPIDVVSEVLRHQGDRYDEATIAFTKSDQAQAALVGMRVA